MLTKKIHTVTRFFTHAQSRNSRNYSNEILHIESLAGWLDVVIYSKRHPNWYRGLGASGVQIFASPIGFRHCVLHYPRIRVKVTKRSFIVRSLYKDKPVIL